MIAQYLSIKEEYPDTILFYRMGDFYEMFFEDAQVASRVLEITLTSRNKNDPSPVPMCGVPYRAAQGYIARLIDNGFKVAICDQTEDPAKAKGLVKREVVRVITPGMIIENELLDAKANNYLLALVINRSNSGLAYIDLSTGCFRLTQSTDTLGIIDEIRRIAPREILLPESAAREDDYNKLLEYAVDRVVTYLPDRVFQYSNGRNRLLGQFKTLNLEGFGCEGLQFGVGAAGALLYYVGETQKQQIDHFDTIETYDLGHHLIVDDTSCRNLELLSNIRNASRKGTLIEVMDKSITSMGGRLLVHWMRYPLIDATSIEKRLDAVEEAKANIQLTRQIRDHFKDVYDIERLRTKIAMGHANARDLTALKRSLQSLPAILDALSQFSVALFTFTGRPGDLEGLAGLIHAAIREDAPPTTNEGGMIRAGYDEALDELIQINRDGKSWLVNLEVEERRKTGINALKVRYNKVFGYYIEIPKRRSEEVPANYIRKQTLVNAERYITDELKHFENKVLGAEDQRARMEYEIFDRIRAQINAQGTQLQLTAGFLAQVDCLLNLAVIADENDYTRPTITTGGEIRIEEGRHPVVEKVITGERFVPNTIEMDDVANQVLVITGPNMAGKSTVLRQVALIVIMAQMGSFVPAKKATTAITDRIFTRVGALDNLSSGQSTFMVEMQETANILNNASANSLVIMDEIGRGTSTFDGLSIAWAVAEHLHDLKKKGVKTLFATHYHELTELARTKARVQNFNIAVKEWNDEIIFLRKLVAGGTNRSYGIQVARLAGIPEKVIRRSKKILARIEENQGDVIASSRDLQGQVLAPKGHIQLSLFSKPERYLFDKIQNIDITKMAPIDALNCLHALQEKTKNMVN
jgi:DNA mismatch repair protein MutS